MTRKHTQGKTGLWVTPNPFHKNLKIKFQIPSTKSQTNSDTKIPNSKLQPLLKIYDASGRLVKSFALSPMPSVLSLVWTGDDDSGRMVPAGVYFIRLETGDHKQVQKVILLK
jgi:flagellar hook assembly protein FlgD